MEKRLGVMIDCSRNAVMKVEKVKEFVLTLKSFGYNSLMLYTEDTYELDGEPYFGYLRGRYSKNELKEIDAFCQSVGFELIPCIQTLAHLNQAFKYWFFEDIRDCFDILLVDEEKTYAFIEKMFATCANVFTSRKIHIGMDEAMFVGMGKHLVKHGYQNRFEILKRHLSRVVAIAQKYGFEPIMWSDMFFRLDNGGEYYPKEPELSQEAKDAIPQNVTLCYWDYYHNDKDYYAKMIRAHKSSGNEVWFAGGAWKWVGFCPGNIKTMDTMLPAMTACREEGVENVFITMWGDDGNECQVYSLLPSLLYVAEVYNGNSDLDSVKKKFAEIVGEDFDEFVALDMALEGFNRDDSFVNGSKPMLYADPFLGLLDAFARGDEGAAYGRIAEQMSAYKAINGKYKLYFENAINLAKTLSYKYNLGLYTRKYYKAGDKAGLKKTLADYDRTIECLDRFLDGFERLWFDMNKPNGFESQQIRLGGLKERLKRCRARLNAFVLGEIDVIEELEEDLVDEKDKKLPYLHGYGSAATVNIL